MWKKENIAVTPKEVHNRHSNNRIAWNEGALKYRENNQKSVELLQKGKSNIHPIEKENFARIGPLKNWCKRAIHLQCASGYDTLSLILEGAKEAIGIDISDVHIENAKWIANQLDFHATWHRCDILDTPQELNSSADLVYTGRGAICWIHDLNSWSTVIFRLLKKGGILSLFDDHPINWLIDAEAEEIVFSGVDYFDHAECNKGWPKEYLGHLGKPVEEEAIKHERLWTIGNIIQSLINAGLSIEFFGEHPDEYWSGFPNLKKSDKQKIPMTFSLIARKQ